MLLKPSEKDPGAAMLLAKLAQQAGMGMCMVYGLCHVAIGILHARHLTPPLSHTLTCPLPSGLPDGVLQIVHGAHNTVNFLCDAPSIRAISFVGGDMAGKYIHARGTGNGKRVQANLGAKNHATVLPGETHLHGYGR